MEHGIKIDNVPVMSNAEDGLPAITIASSIKLSQLLYLFRTAYITVKHLKQMAVFGQLICQLSNSPLELKRMVN
ncbi:2017_t:CDS:2 [Funneliformis geosporum]|nr:2017_t:CDS:2 [Funneliformis geosporum]